MGQRRRGGVSGLPKLFGCRVLPCCWVGGGWVSISASCAASPRGRGRRPATAAPPFDIPSLCPAGALTGDQERRLLCHAVRRIEKRAESDVYQGHGTSRHTRCCAVRPVVVVAYPGLVECGRAPVVVVYLVHVAWTSFVACVGRAGEVRPGLFEFAAATVRRCRSTDGAVLCLMVRRERSDLI